MNALNNVTDGGQCNVVASGLVNAVFVPLLTTIV